MSLNVLPPTSCRIPTNYLSSSIYPLIDSYIKSNPQVPIIFFEMFKQSLKPFLKPSVLRKQFVPSTVPKVLAIRMSSSATPNELLNVNKLYDVSNYTAVVTGGGTGIGLMITQTLVANGAKVYITGRRGDALDKVVEKYGKGAKGSIVALPPCDINNKDEIKMIVSEVEKNDKGIHLLVNNAGVAKDDTTKYSNGEPDFKVSEDED
jgi:hypothetical protein